ncbi:MULTISPECIES: hypothetical protein [unclassified Pseudomonas]|uniref:hypothetical protein n=1 Tax=unclassified Pseudomonas TaxID=196821 RepID=UPI001CBD36EB|nr:MULTISPECIES: hypothetical protein [unclassified Pseudomonas]
MNTAFLTPGCRIERFRLSPEKLKITGFQSPAGDHEQGPLSIDDFVGPDASLIFGSGSPTVTLWRASVSTSTMSWS